MDSRCPKNLLNNIQEKIYVKVERYFQFVKMKTARLYSCVFLIITIHKDLKCY